MKYLLAILIFFIVLFLYLHVQFHYKTGEDLEIYTIENPSKDKMEEICDIRQPVILDIGINNVKDDCKLQTLDENYGAFDVKIRNNNWNFKEGKQLHLPIILNEALKLFQGDDDKKLITENNYEFLEETGLIKTYKYNDGFLRPSMVSNCDYDLLSGSQGATTPLKYNNTYRNFYYVTSGNIKLKLIPPNYSKYLDIKKDYENKEYISPMNPWDIQKKYKRDFNKVKTLDVELKEGQLIFIPAYWHYSIYYTEISSVSVFKYRTYMNMVAILPTIIMEFLQQQNIDRKLFNNISKIANNKKLVTSNEKKE